MFGYDKPKTKSTTRLGTGKMGKWQRGKWKTPIYALMPDQQMFFHYFRLFSPFITCSRQQAAAVLATRPGEPQQHGPNTEITNEAKGKLSG